MTPIYQQDRRPTVKRVRWMLLIGALLLVAAFVALPIVATRR
jgi:ABC-type sugar transport system permease subunit